MDALTYWWAIAQQQRKAMEKCIAISKMSGLDSGTVADMADYLRVGLGRKPICPLMPYK